MPVLADELSTKYADLDNRSFKYNGEIMTLGASTLQDFVDAGAELDEWSSFSHAGKNFEVQFDDHFSGQFPYGCAIYYLRLNTPNTSVTAVSLFFIAPHNLPCKLKECVLAKIDMDVNDITPSSPNSIADGFEFSFDRTLTYDALVENSGEPNYEDHGYNYKVVSDETPRYDSGYRFSFGSDGLSHLEMTWIP
jgi:hypothetical protein